MQPYYSELSNGYRIVHLPSDGEVEYLGVIVNAGSRDEERADEGLAHFVEHTIFKGTHKRKAWHILNRMEIIGGELNAYTTKEETVVYSIFPFGYLRRASELIADLLTDSIFPEVEINREKDVVEEEILSYLDTPAEDIFDRFDNFIFAGSSLAHNILGSVDSLAAINSEKCRKWLMTKFIPSQSVIFYMGKRDKNKVFSVINSVFSGISRSINDLKRNSPDFLKPFSKEFIIPSLHQSHHLAGVRIPGLFSTLRPAYTLLSNYLGGPGMNSVLNLELRERRGLVYSIDTATVSYTDCGLLTVYYGCDKKDESRCVDILRKVLKEISNSGLSAKKLASVKRQFIGQMILSGENREQTVLSAARSMLHRNKVNTWAENVALIESVTDSQIMEAASTLSPDDFSWLTIKGE